MTPVELHMLLLTLLWIVHMQHNQVGKSGLQSLNVFLLREVELNLMLFSKGRILYQIGYQMYSLLVGCSLQMLKVGRTTFMVYNGFTISMHGRVFIFNLQTNIVFFFVMAMTAISRRTLLVTAFKIVSSLFFFRLILPTLCNH